MFSRMFCCCAQSFFVDAIEEWRVAMGIERFVLVGHSLGAVIVTAYAVKVWAI